MFELKPLAKEAIPRALEKAERYRLLNEPAQAESICLDVIQLEPDNPKALVILLLALTDQFDKKDAVAAAREILPRLKTDYEKAYYAGIICERRAKALMDHAGPGSGFTSYHWFREAMDWYEKAEKLRSPGNDDAILRWNTCARAIMSHPHLRPAPDDQTEPPLE